MGYTTTVIEVGSDAEAFLAEQTAITFAGDAPAALRPYCFLIEAGTLDHDLEVGQSVRIAEQLWTITALGEVAQKNLVNLGHVTLVFDGADRPRLPGALHLGGLTEAPALRLGTSVVFGV